MNIQLKNAILADCDRLEVLIHRAESEGRDFNAEEQAEFEAIRASIDAAKAANPPENSMQQPATAVFKKVPPATPPAVHTRGDRSYSLLNVVKNAIDRSHDAGYEFEIGQELQDRAPWVRNQRGMDSGVIVPVAALLGVSKQSGTTPGGSENMLPLVGIDQRSDLFRIDTAIQRATITDKINATTLEGLVEKSVTFPRQTAPMSAGHVAIDSNLPTSADPAFDTVSLEPHLVGAVTELKLSSIFATHPAAGSTDWISAELRRALTAEIDRAVLSGDSGTAPAEPDGIDQQATVAATTPITVATATTLDELNALGAEMRAYLQVDDLAAVQAAFVHQPKFHEALQSLPSFTGSGNSLASDIEQGAAARIGRWVPSEVLPVTPGATDTAPAYLIANPSYIIHGFWGMASVTINPYADSVFASGGTLVRIFVMHDFLLVDPKRALKTTTNLAP